MKFTAFVLATAATSAAAQFNNGFNNFNPFNGVQGNVQGNVGGVAYSPYGVQQPIQAYGVQQPYGFNTPYGVQQPIFNQPQDPLAWERDCTWVNSINFRAALSLATCGKVNCQGTQPNGNGGGYDRKTLITPTAAAPNQGATQFHVWGSVINRAGRVCAVAYTGGDLTQQFPYGRVQSMKRANTANSLSIPKRAMPSHVADNHKFVDADWFSRYSSQLQNPANTRTGFNDPGRADNAWYGFSHDRYNPGNIDVQFQGATSNYGEACGTTRQDPMCMQKPGGMDFSAGGLSLFDINGILRGAIGVAGDNDCTSHSIAWKTREQMRLNYTPVNTERSTFNSHASCVLSAGVNFRDAAVVNAANSAAYRTWRETPTELCSLDLLQPASYTALRATAPVQTVPVKFATWGHTGSKAEDNVFFHNSEARNFPACYDLIRRFPIDNPTQTAQGATTKA